MDRRISHVRGRLSAQVLQMQDELRRLQEASLELPRAAWNGRQRRQVKEKIAALEAALQEKTEGYKSARSSAQALGTTLSSPCQILAGP